MGQQRPTRISTASAPPRARAEKPSLSDRESARKVRVLGARDLLVVRGTADQRIAAIAGRQRGRVARRQLLAAGLTDPAIRRRIASGRLIRRRAGVYGVGYVAW